MVGRAIVLITLLAVLTALWIVSATVTVGTDLGHGRFVALLTLPVIGVVAFLALKSRRRGSNQRGRRNGDGFLCAGVGSACDDGAHDVTVQVCSSSLSSPTSTVASLAHRSAKVDVEADDDGFLSCEEEGLEDGLRVAPANEFEVWTEADWEAEGLAVESKLVDALARATTAAVAASSSSAGAGERGDPEAGVRPHPPRAALNAAMLRRLLLAAGKDVSKAVELHAKALQESERSRTFAAGAGRDAVARARRAGLCFLLPEHATDRQGHPVLVFNGGAHDTKLFKPEVVTAAMMQLAAEAEAAVERARALRGRRIAKALLIFYLPKGTPVDVSGYSTMIGALTTAHPEGLSSCLVCPVDGKVAWMYRFIKPFMPASLQSIVTFVAPGKWRKAEFVEEMTSYFDLKLLPETFGGHLAWWPEGANGRKERWKLNSP
eukprot:TRINITY_DN74213_c0_g1_i1.p1 TRINITY_DN74213_c0_g1~~TRINITY_DN74213_c0_g1_i1.p1  ORF type:complete len:451 (+),score=97.51 TRINITY_DN74213_c0_g1_i1:52-1353(+)